MNTEKMVCRVCGKEYPPCRTAQRNPNVFHWQEVACSPECGEIYLKRILESRQATRTNSVETDPIPATAEVEVTGMLADFE